MAWEDPFQFYSGSASERVRIQGLVSHPIMVGKRRNEHVNTFDKLGSRSICSVMMTKLFLLFTALMFTAFGAWSITDPVGMTARLGVSAEGISGVFEMRGIYGGVSLGAALLCLLGGLRTRFEFPALCFIAAYMGGYVLGRGASFAFGDTAMSSNWYFAGFELVMFIIAAALVRQKA